MQPNSKQCYREKSSGLNQHASLRCLCGSLLARLVPEGVELKCRKCKRHVILPLDSKMEREKQFRSRTFREMGNLEIGKVAR
jgi:phage FluMu protein Com